MRAARSISAVSEISRPGPIAPPRYSPSAETTSTLIPVPKSTTTQASLESLVGGDRVDQAVGADLERVVDADRHPGLQPGTDGQALGVEVALGELLELGAERWHDGGDADGVDFAERHPTEGEKPGDALGQLVSRRPRASLKAPVLDQALAIEGTEVSLGVADVDRKEHGAIIPDTG